MGWSLLDIWVHPLNRHVNARGLMLDPGMFGYKPMIWMPKVLSLFPFV